MDFSPCKMDRSQVPEGMDPETTFKIKLRTSSYSSRTDAGSYTFSKYVDKDTTNYKDFVEEYAKEYPWGLNETLHLSYFDENLKSYVDVRNDQDLMTMFGKFESSEYIELNAHILLVAATQTVTDNTNNAPHNVSCNLSNDEVSPCTPCTPKPDQASSIQQVISPLQPVLCDTSYLANPFPMYEHVGVDEEGLYGVEVASVSIPTEDEHINGQAEVGHNVEEEESSEEEESDEEEEGSHEEETREKAKSTEEASGTAPDDEIADDWVVRDVIPDFSPLVAYDKEDPPMHVGAKYRSLPEFKVALSQHAIKHEREWKTEKSDPDRVRVHCISKKKGCKWRLHASTLQDKVTVQVKVNPYSHTCSSKRRSKKAKNTTKAWISEQVLDWIKEEPNVGAKELQRRIKDKYHILVHVVDLVDILRRMIMRKFEERRMVVTKLVGVILPHVVNELTAKSFDLKFEIVRNGAYRAEISGREWTFTRRLEHFRNIVDIHEKTCTCREWQLTGNPCLHAIAFLTSINEDLENYVDKYYSVEKFIATYSGRVSACVDKRQWPKCDKGFFLFPPLLRKVAGRPRTLRIKAAHEPGTKSKGTAHQCQICKGYRHHWKNCKEGDPAAKEALAKLTAKLKAEKKRATKKAIQQALASVTGASSSAATMISTRCYGHCSSRCTIFKCGRCLNQSKKADLKKVQESK